MNRDDIIRMAKEAGDFRELWNEQRHIGDIRDFLCRFAALVAAAEREACARVCDDISRVAYIWWDTRAAPEDQGRVMGAGDCAAAIRARSEP